MKLQPRVQALAGLTAFGPRRTLACTLVACRHPRDRGRRHPLAAPTSAVLASLRLPCGARTLGPRHNSLRSLRSLRSDKCRESDVEARGYARGQDSCAPRRSTRRVQRMPPAAPTAVRRGSEYQHRHQACEHSGARLGSARAAGGARRARRVERRATQLGGGARTRALREPTRGTCPSAANEVSAASCAARPQASSAGQSVRAARGPRKSARQAGTACRDRADAGTSGMTRTSAAGRKRPPDERTHFTRCKSREAEWSD